MLCIFWCATFIVAIVFSVACEEWSACLSEVSHVAVWTIQSVNSTFIEFCVIAGRMMMCLLRQKVFNSIFCFVCYFYVGMFKEFCNKFNFWSYVGEGGSDCFFLFVGWYVLRDVSVETWGLFVVFVVVTVCMNLSRVWGLYLLLYKMHLIVLYSCCLSVSCRGYEMRWW